MYHTRGRLSLRNERRAMAQGMMRGQDPLNSPYVSRKPWRGLHHHHPKPPDASGAYRGAEPGASEPQERTGTESGDFCSR
jgi:hypothetical protein